MRIKCGDVYVDRERIRPTLAAKIRKEIADIREREAYRLAYAHAGLGIGEAQRVARRFWQVSKTWHVDDDLHCGGCWEFARGYGDDPLA